MELNKISSFVLAVVFVGLLLGAGILMISKLGSNAFYLRTNYNDTIAVLNSTATALDKGNITTVNFVRYLNASSIPSSCYVLDLTNSTFKTINPDNATCGMTNNFTQITQSFAVGYDYKEYDTETEAATGAIVRELGRIPTDWLGLIVTIVVLSIIIVLVMRSFGGTGRTN